ncbi:MAG: HU family DNA-binding protein [Peptoniphilus harei]|nr:HU family DNA-binding protein [Peptoniphilus harei]
MNKAELVTQISHKTGLKREDSKKALEAFLETVQESLVNQEKVQLVGFGSFDTKFVKERTGVNPQNPEEIINIPARYKVSFKPSKTLKETVNA